MFSALLAALLAALLSALSGNPAPPPPPPTIVTPTTHAPAPKWDLWYVEAPWSTPCTFALADGTTYTLKPKLYANIGSQTIPKAVPGKTACKVTYNRTLTAVPPTIYSTNQPGLAPDPAAPVPPTTAPAPATTAPATTTTTVPPTTVPPTTVPPTTTTTTAPPAATTTTWPRVAIPPSTAPGAPTTTYPPAPTTTAPLRTFRIDAPRDYDCVFSADNVPHTVKAHTSAWVSTAGKIIFDTANAGPCELYLVG